MRFISGLREEPKSPIKMSNYIYIDTDEDPYLEKRLSQVSLDIGYNPMSFNDDDSYINRNPTQELRNIKIEELLMPL